MTGTALFAAAMASSFDETDAVCSLSARHPSDWAFTWPDFDRACRRRLRMCRISYQISKTEVAVDQPANENTRRPAEIYTRNTGHAVVDNLI